MTYKLVLILSSKENQWSQSNNYFFSNTLGRVPEHIWLAMCGVAIPLYGFLAANIQLCVLITHRRLKYIKRRL